VQSVQQLLLDVLFFQDQTDRFGNTRIIGESVTVVVEDQSDNRPEWVKICSIKNLKENANPVSKFSFQKVFLFII
jgi:hypothetical protein